MIDEKRLTALAEQAEWDDAVELPGEEMEELVRLARLGLMREHAVKSEIFESILKKMGADLKRLTSLGAWAEGYGIPALEYVRDAWPNEPYLQASLNEALAALPKEDPK